MSQAAAQQPSRKKAVISLLVLLVLTCIIVFTFKDHWAEITAALAQLSVWQVLAGAAPLATWLRWVPVRCRCSCTTCTRPGCRWAPARG